VQVFFLFKCSFRLLSSNVNTDVVRGVIGVVDDDDDTLLLQVI
jgi:hypothetical protein